ncbi:Cyclin-dependent kinase 20 [Tyrophagus putrescentiae]|nr:Cyclin-dependent kinase 20 [Tyrophagus putrescentiae]
MVKPSSILSSLMSRPKPPAAVSGNSNFNWQPSENTSTSTPDNNFAQYYQSTFFSKLDALNGVKRFNERYRIKGHLGAGAHGLILWATDRTPPQPQPSVFDTKNSTTTVDSFDLEQNVLETEDAYFRDTSSSGEDSDATTVDENEELTATKRQIFSSKSRQYAVKRMFIRNRVVPVSVIREIKVLQYLSSSGGRGGHPHIIDLLDVSPSGSSVNLVFPLLPTNLTTLIYSSPPSLNSRQCALYGRMLAEGVAYLHSNGIIHRDLKPANLLIDWEGILKIADFGQARAIDIGLEVNGRRSELTYQVCTRWYRAPELLYGATNYGYDVDLWSVGCILGEMLGRWPLFKGDTDIEQLSLVVRALGTPKGAWTELLPDFNKITFVHDDEEEERNESFDDQQILSTGGSTRWPRWLESLRQKCCSRGSPASSASSAARCPDQVLDLLFKLCRYTDRLNAQELLAHPFLNFEPGAGKALRRLLVRSKAVKHLSGPQKNHEPPPPNPSAVVV